MNARAALQNGARASAIKPNNKEDSKNSRVGTANWPYRRLQPTRTHTQVWDLKVVELGMGSSRFELRVSALAGFGARVFAVALIIRRLNCAGSRPILERRARVHAAVRRS